MTLEQNSNGYEFNNVLNKLPGETDEAFLKRTGQKSTAVTAQELQAILDQKETVDEVTRREEEKGGKVSE